MSSISEDRPRRRRLHAAFFCFGMGLLSLYSGLNRLGISSMRTLDLVHLLCTGALLGIGLVSLVLALGRRTG
jgi:uncharacterized protein involved in response to NO